MKDRVELPFVRNPYNYDRDQVSDLTSLLCEDESLTKQSFTEECDINYIVKMFGLTGKLPDVTWNPPVYGDFSGVLDYRSALDAVKAAEASFMELPPDIRFRFHNDPQAFLEFCSDEGNRGALLEMGLAVPKEGYGMDGKPLPEPVMKVEVINPDPVDAGASKASGKV